MYDEGKKDFKMNIHFINFMLLVVVVVMLIFVVTSINPKPANFFDDLKGKLAKHPEMKDYSTLYPRATLLTSEVISQAKTSGLTFFENATVNSYLLEYDGLTVIYDFNNDKIINFFEQEKAPADLLDKLIAHRALESYKGVTPAIGRVTAQNIVQLRNQSIELYKDAKVGDYIIQYNDRVVVFDYEKDEIVSNVAAPTQAQANLPSDFFQKLVAHPGLEKYSKESPVGGVLDEQSLLQLTQQMPNVYKDAKVGDYLLRYSDIIVIYDYNADNIVNMVQITPQ